MLKLEQIIDSAGHLVPSRDDSHAKYLPAMQMHQDMVRMHADLSVGAETGMAMKMFLKKVQDILPKQKFDVFCSLMSHPLDTVPVVSTVFDRLGRIFEGVNPVYNYHFTEPSYAADWDVYRKERLDEPNVWREKAWQYFQTEPNSVLVVDMPVERDPKDKLMQPYFYWVTTNDIIDYSTKENGDIAWIIYRNEDRKRIYVVDDKYYRSFPYVVEDGQRMLDRIHMTENEHPLGYCPAAFFLSDPISLSIPDVKRSPITKALGLLDWYLFFRTSEKHLDLSGSYPIYSGYESKCDYEAEIVNEGGERHTEMCNGHGTLVDEDGNVITDPDTGMPKVCPKCRGRHNTAGPGSFIEVPVPENTEGGIPDLIEAVKMLGADVDALEFNDKKSTSLKNEIISTCVGVEGDVFTEFSISEKQVDANYESQSTILVRIKKEFENAQWFADHTCCLLRYGKRYVSCQINYGTKFYTLTAEKLREMYAKAKESGATQTDLIAMRKQIIETDYRTDPLMCERMLILADVEPLLGMTDQEATDLLAKGLVAEDDVKVKVNFDSLIRRFELDNGDILNFGSATDYRQKINTIQETLRSYVKGIKPRESNLGGVRQDAPVGGESGE